MKILGHELDHYESLLFDLDGTLIDSMAWHNKAWIETFREFGVLIDEEFLQETAGLASVRIVEIINERDKLHLDAKTVSLKKRQRYLENISKVKVVPELLEVIKYYYQKRPLAIITGGSHAVVDDLLPMLKIDHYFDAVICSDDTNKGKDSEEPYLLASSRLKVDLSKSIFFDDGDVGLKGASLVGLKAVHVDLKKGFLP